MVISPLIHHLYALFLEAWGWICQNDVKIFLDLEIVMLIMHYTVDQGFLFSFFFCFFEFPNTVVFLRGTERGRGVGGRVVSLGSAE